MPKVPYAGEDHGDPVFVGAGNHLGITHRTTGLNHCLYPCFGGGIHTIPKREEGIGSEDCALQRKAEFFCLGGTAASGIDATHLSCANAQGAPIGGIDDGIGAHMFGNLPGKAQILQLRGARLALADHPPLRLIFDEIVILLQEQATTNALVVPGTGLPPLCNVTKGQYPQILLARQDSRCLGIDCRRQDHLDEGFRQQLRHAGIDGAITGNDAAKGRDRVCRPSAGKGIGGIAPNGGAARIPVFDDGASRLGKLHHQIYRRVAVAQIVVGQLLAL